MKNPAYYQFFAVAGFCTNLLHGHTPAADPTRPADAEGVVSVIQQRSSAVVTAANPASRVIAISPVATVVGNYKVLSPAEAAAADAAAALAKANHKTTQAEIAKAGIWKYIEGFPQRFRQHALDLFGLGNFELYENEAEQHPQHSPFRIFDFAQNRIQPSREWSLSFQNNSYQFIEQIDVEWGLCAGVTYLQRRMNMLVHYDFENKWAQSVPDQTVNREMYINYLKSKIDEVMNLKMTIVPGFHNLYELSSVPEIKTYLKEKVVELWQTENIDILQGVKQGLLATKKENLSPAEMTTLYENLNTRLNLGYSPIVYLLQHSDHPFKPEGQWIHTLAITRLSKRYRSGGFTFHVWDINEAGEYADSKVIIHKDGHPYYEGRKLGDVELLQWDDLEIAKSIENNVEFCNLHEGICH
jgi:hypothetical protein